MRHADISVRVKTIVLPNVPAAKLLANPKTACFAPGANAGSWSDKELCTRVAASLRASNASWPERHLAVVAALMQKRYDAMVTAMEHLQMEPIIIEDLVKYGEDIGFDRGAVQARTRVYADLLGLRLGRSLTPNEHDMLAQRVVAMSNERLFELIQDVTPGALAEWFANPNANAQ
jgi:hypothetical protein